MTDSLTDWLKDQAAQTLAKGSPQGPAEALGLVPSSAPPAAVHSISPPVVDEPAYGAESHADYHGGEVTSAKRRGSGEGDTGPVTAPAKAGALVQPLDWAWIFKPAKGSAAMRQVWPPPPPLQQPSPAMMLPQTLQYTPSPLGMAGAQQSAGVLPPPGLPSMGSGHSALPPSASVEAAAAAAAALETQLQPRQTPFAAQVQAPHGGVPPLPSQPPQPSQARLSGSTVAAAASPLMAPAGPAASARANGPVLPAAVPPLAAPPTAVAAADSLPAVDSAGAPRPAQPTAPNANAPTQPQPPAVVGDAGSRLLRDAAEAAVDAGPLDAEAETAAEQPTTTAAATAGEPGPLNAGPAADAASPAVTGAPPSPSAARPGVLPPEVSDQSVALVAAPAAPAEEAAAEQPSMSGTPPVSGARVSAPQAPPLPASWAEWQVYAAQPPIFIASYALPRIFEHGFSQALLWQ